METIPQWIGATIIATIIALFGYIGKNIHKEIIKQKKNKNRKYAFLIELHSLLKASWDVFKKQAEIRNNLSSLLKKRLKVEIPQDKGFEKFISGHYSEFNEDELEMHSVIRGYSSALFELNTSILNWLKKDYTFKTTHKKKGAMLSLSKKLNLLESHLYLWIAKYNFWIPTNIKHSLVYLADEEYHGTPFPKGIEKDLEEVLLINTSVTF